MGQILIIMPTKSDIRLVVERVFTRVAGGPENTKTVDINKQSRAIKQIEETYDVKILGPTLTIDQIVDICYTAGRAKALLKIKLLINEYHIESEEIFPDETQSIH